MRARILEALANIEKTEGVKILLAVESGSRVWGFHSVNSDYDVRFIYVRPAAHYLSVFDKRDCLEYPLSSDDLDVSGWDVRKACKLLYKSNPPLIEWLNSPLIYRQDRAIEPLRAASKYYFNARAALYHYLKMAQGNYRTYLKGETVQLKKYFYVLRPLLACHWIYVRHDPPPVQFVDLMRAMQGTQGFPYGEITDLVNRKMVGEELGTGPRIDAINVWCEAQIEHFDKVAGLANTPTMDTGLLDSYFLHVVLNSGFQQGKYP